MPALSRTDVRASLPWLGLNETDSRGGASNVAHLYLRQTSVLRHHYLSHVVSALSIFERFSFLVIQKARARKNLVRLFGGRIQSIALDRIVHGHRNTFRCYEGHNDDGTRDCARTLSSNVAKLRQASESQKGQPGAPAMNSRDAMAAQQHL